MTSGITVVVPTIPPRKRLLARALGSAAMQDLPPDEIIAVSDTGREGAAVTRTRGLNKVTTEWVAFLDDDDAFMYHHLRTLKMAQESTGADLVFPWFEVVGGTDPFPHNRGKQYDLAAPHQIPITVLVRTEAVRAVGGFLDPGLDDAGVDAEGNRTGEDYATWLRMAQAGYRFVHHDQVTWQWFHDSFNTSGRPDRW